MVHVAGVVVSGQQSCNQEATAAEVNVEVTAVAVI